MSKSTLMVVQMAALLLCLAAPQSFGQTVVPATKEQEAKLIAVLQSDAAHKEKADACRLLSIIGTKDAVPALAALLADEQLSHMARYGLEPIPDRAVDDALLNALGTLQGRPLIGVITSLGVRGDPRAVAPLSQRLQHSDATTAQAAARALGEFGSAPAAKALREALANAPAPNQLALCEGLFRCAEILASQGKRADAIAIFDLLRARSEPHQVRAGALRGAILNRQEEGLALLREHLRSTDYILFSAAVQCAQEMSGPQVTQALTDGLAQRPADHQILVLQTIGQRGDPSALPAVIQIAKRGELPVRLAAISALGELGDASVVPTLFEAAVDAEGTVAKAARTTLAGLASNREVDAAILAMIQTGNTQARQIAIEVVAQRRATSGNDALFKAAEDPDQQIRLAAINALGQTGESENLPQLVDLLVRRQNNDELRAAENAVQTVCGKTSDKPAAAKILLAALPQASVDAKCSLLRLTRVTGGQEALQTVRKAAQDANAQVQEAAIRTLCEWPNAEAAPDLLAMAKTSDNPSRQIAALRGFVNLIRDDTLSTEKKLDMSKQAAALVQRDEEKKLLLGVLGGVPSSEALSMVMDHLDNPATKNEACQAAVAICERIIEQKPAVVAAALPEVMKATDNRALTRRARELLNKAKSAAGQ